MLPTFAAHIVTILIVAVSILLMLLRPRGIAEAWWVCGGATLLIALRLVSLHAAGAAVLEGADVYLFLTGMMLLSELARTFGVFDWMATVAEEHANGSSVRLFTLIYLVGIAVTVFMSNDATAVVLTPAVMAATRKAKARPLPYLFACALIANAASFVLPISNPANLVVFRTQMPPLLAWLKAFALPSALSIIATYFVLRACFRRDLQQPISNGAKTRLTGNGRLVLAGLIAVALVLVLASALGRDLGLPTCLAASVVTLFALIRTRRNPWPIVRHISWSVLPLVAGLFVLVAAIQSLGAMHFAASTLQWAQRLPAGTGAFVIGGGVGFANNIVNNLPLGLIAGSTLKATHAHGLIANAVLIGVDLGPNLSVTGSLATILWLIVLRREGIDVSFSRFLRIGIVAMPIALIAALGAAVLLNGL
jgi:arsenical pump membrane protein